MFYGLWAFAAATANDSVVIDVDTLASTSTYLKAWAVTDATGASRVVLLHKDPAPGAPTNATITVMPPSPLTGAATLTRLLPNDPAGIRANASAPITWGGRTFRGTPDGTPSGEAVMESVAPNAAGAYVVELPRGSAAMLALPAS